MVLFMLARMLLAVGATYLLVSTEVFQDAQQKYVTSVFGYSTCVERLVFVLVTLMNAIVVFRLWPASADELSGFGRYASQISTAISAPYPGSDAAVQF